MKRIMALAVLLCAWLLAGSPATAQRSYADIEVYDNGGSPDLTIDAKRLVSQMSIVDRYFDPDGCEVKEGSISEPGGYRRILRFDTVVINAGHGDLVVGDPSAPEDPSVVFYFSPCHGHYHLKDFSLYELLDSDGTSVARSYKQGFCLEDNFKYVGGKSSGYDCHFQGITSGWGDWYYKQLGGQWIDITGLPESDYILRVRINWGNIFDEGENRYPNVIEVPVHIPDPRNKVSGP